MSLRLGWGSSPPAEPRDARRDGERHKTASGTTSTSHVTLRPVQLSLPEIGGPVGYSGE